MPDERTREERSWGIGLKAVTTQPQFRQASTETDVEERIEMDIQRRALERFKRDDYGYEPVTPRKDYDY